MSLDDVRDALADANTRNKWLGVWVGVLAALLAICSMGGDNATKDANRANIDATNTWAFFQAKNIRRSALSLAADDLELTLLSQPGLPAEVRAAIEAKIKSYRDTVKVYTSDPKTMEGLDELFARAKGIEQERDRALRKDPYFDFAQALLQIGIVLASVAIIAGTDALVLLSFVVGGLGTLLMLNGFMLLVSLPGFG
ncbi:MAG TPA: DUF4337 domain-containing protein [Hyphomicrobiaceae bacterium]|nr:DUF4337 domain-containing protein [Hyphomicrobiaceae bacterium]